MKKTIRILAAVLLLVMLAGCGGKPTPATPDPAVTPAAETPAQTETPAAPTEIPVVTPLPTETPAPTPTPSPTPTPAGNLPIIKKDPTSETVAEGGSCWFEARYENAIWAVWHFVSPDGQSDITYEVAMQTFPEMEIIDGMYSSMKLNNIPYAANGWKVYCRYSNNNGYTDTKTATLTVTPAPKPTTTPTPTPGPVVNEWKDFTSLEEAVAYAGVSFTPPIDEALPEGVKLELYRACPGIIEARYSDGSGSNALSIRKSGTTKGDELAGDFNSYSQTWEQSLKGVTLQCRGDGTRANVATFTAGGTVHYAILFHPGKEGEGLTGDQLNSLINGMS